MRRIQGPGATPSNMFTEGDPVAGVAPTTVTAAWLNAVQEELAAAIEGSGRALDPTDNTQLLSVLLQLTGRFRNALHNPAMRFWQRSTGQISGSARVLPCDRWISSSGLGAASATITRQAFPFGDANVPFRPLYFLRHDQTAASGQTQDPHLRQRIEDVSTLAGGPATVSFWARINSGSTTVTPETRQRFGGAGGGSSDVTKANAAITLTNQWARYTSTFDLDSVTGKTLGASDDYLELSLRFQQGQTFQVDVVGVQLEFGQNASSFEVRPEPLELSLCRRFYETSLGIDQAFPTQATDLGARTMHQTTGIAQFYAFEEGFRVPKFKVPTVTWFNPLTGNADEVEHPLTVNKTLAGGSTNVTKDSTGYPVGATAATGGQYARAYWTAEATLI